MTKEFPEFQTGKLLLRHIVKSDIENIHRGLSHPEVVRYYGVSFKTMEETKEQMNWFIRLERTGTGIWWAICSRDNRTFYGAGGLNDVDRERKKAEIGFWLLPDFWGQGIIMEALALIVDYGFHHFKLHRIEGFVESKNENCKRALTKMDFAYEGTLKDCEIKNSEYISLEIYAKFSASAGT